MPNTRIVLALASLCLLFSGCTTLGAKYTPETAVPTNKAAVYVYRPGSLGAAISPNVQANGVPLSDLPAHGYFVYDATPRGTHSHCAHGSDNICHAGHQGRRNVLRERLARNGLLRWPSAPRSRRERRGRVGNKGLQAGAGNHTDCGSCRRGAAAYSS